MRMILRQFVIDLLSVGLIVVFLAFCGLVAGCATQPQGVVAKDSEGNVRTLENVGIATRQTQWEFGPNGIQKKRFRARLPCTRIHPKECN